MAYAINVRGMIPPQHPVGFQKTLQIADQTGTTAWQDLGKMARWYLAFKIKIKSLTGTSPSVIFTINVADDNAGSNVLMAARSVTIFSTGTITLDGWTDDPKQFVQIAAGLGGTNPAITYDVEVWAIEV